MKHGYFKKKIARWKKIRCKWVYELKFDVVGKIDCYKIKLCAKEYT